jgi:hypothetical protein
MSTTFTKLNEGWNAEPNVPDPRVSVEGSEVALTFLLNDMMYPKYETAEKGILRFRNCWRYRLGSTNDHGWYLGQCRFSHLAPEWGEFYEVRGDLFLDFVPDPKTLRTHGIQLEPKPLKWVTIGAPANPSRHFLFYLRDETFECDAADYEFSVVWSAEGNAVGD